MEGEQEDSDEDVQEERKTTLLWEKCIRQRIVVDLCDDDSLHVSDLQASLALHPSHAESAMSEASIHFSDDTASDSILVSEGVLPTKSRISQNKELLNRRHEDAGQNTSDEDQEDLPDDGDLGGPYFKGMHDYQTSMTSNGRQSATNAGSTHNDLVSVVPHEEKEEEEVDDKRDEEVAPPCTRPLVDISQVLLRHFSQEELLQTGRLIEAETLPEVSMLESIDDLICSVSTHSNRSGRCLDSDGNSGSKSERLEGNNTASSRDENVAAPVKGEDCGVQIRKVSHLRSRSYGELKYGQGQVHFPLPDFSKVSPKVKIPKGPSGLARLVPQVPSPIIRVQSSPGMLEVISRVLDDSGLQSSQKPQVLKDTQDPTRPVLVLPLEAEYDKLLAKYATAENVIDKMKVGTNSTADIYIEDVPGNSSEAEHDVGPEAAHIQSPDNVGEKVKTGRQDDMTLNASDQDGRSEADKMAAELRALITQFMQTVDDFKRNVSDTSVSTEERQTMLRSLLEAQDQLERKYMSKKEEHRALEMQNYLGLRRNIGTFDPNRLVEGDIFRVGMHLEDIKEMMDKNMHQHVVPPLLSSTPTTKHRSAKVSLPPSLHEVTHFRLTASAEGPLDADDEQLGGEEKESASLEGRARSTDPWIIGKWKSGRVPSDGHGLSSFHPLTTVRPKDVSGQRHESPMQAQPEGPAEQRLRNILKKPSLELQGPDATNRDASETNPSPLLVVEQRQRRLCTCNSEAILALRVEVSRLKKDLEKGLVRLPQLARKMDYLASKYRQDGQERRSKTKSRAYRKTTSSWKSTSSRQSLRDFSCSQLAPDDWISTDADPGRSNEAIMDDLYCKDRRLLLALQPTQRLPLQLGHASSCSLPASYKVKQPPTCVTNYRKRSTRSDTALLPGEVYFQPALRHVFQTPRSGSGSKAEEMNRTLDRAIEAARSMKKTADRMAKRLTADLAKAQLLPKGECAAFGGEGARNIAWLHAKRA
ncbi:uncharacterized protein aknad1 [Hippocampus zosterae]|uniref:uncharacterized protein aknad1 n=1 Tax=Hippocampus zosterae TaxID=109293 RepID=UPI00223E5B7C|nr:uncharacterized protein aknad1 [Hippocampus zosterae]